MTALDILDVILFPIAVLTQLAPLTWGGLWAGVAWLYVRHFRKLGIGYRFSLFVWRASLWVAAVVLTCLLVLAAATPQGPEYYRLAVGAATAVPLVLPAVLGFCLRPQS
jgi:hypothetical protein